MVLVLIAEAIMTKCAFIESIDDIVNADLFIKNEGYCFRLTNFECYCNVDESIDALKEEIHRQIDFLVDECVRAALRG